MNETVFPLHRDPSFPAGTFYWAKEKGLRNEQGNWLG